MDTRLWLLPHSWTFAATHASWSHVPPVKKDISDSKSVPVHVEAVIAPPSPITVYQTPVAGAEKIWGHESQNGTMVLAPSEVDPNKRIPAPGMIGPNASSQKSLSTIRSSSSKDSRVVKLAEIFVEVTSNRYSTPLAAAQDILLDEEEPP